MRAVEPILRRTGAGGSGSGKTQRGVVLLYSLIALGILLIVAVALIRSFNSSLFAAGNIGFKRDMQNQSERAVAHVMEQFRTGALNNSTARAHAVQAQNYSATMLPTNAQGVPDVFKLSPADFARTYSSDITPAASDDIPAPSQIRYVVDRLCATDGDESTLGANVCRLAKAIPTGTSLNNQLGADQDSLCPTCASAVPQATVYRITIMVTGPRNTQSFFQSTFTAPST